MFTLRRSARQASQATRMQFTRRGLTTPSGAVNDLLPIISFKGFLQGNEADKKEVSRQVVEGFKGVGFIYLADHGIPPEAISNAFAQSAKFFSLPLEVKDGLQWERPESNRGYVATGREKVSQIYSKEEVMALRASSPDAKESMEIGRDDAPTWKNMWPKEEECPDFKNTMNAFFQTCHTFQLQLLRSIATGLEFDPAYFDERCNIGDHNLRLLYYPPIDRRLLEGGQSRAGSHSDYGTVTLLFQHSVGGLEVVHPTTGAWVPATPVPGTIVINAGDLLSRWSNDVIRSTVHRVVQPPTGTAPLTPARQSIAFFSNPNMDTVVSAMPNTGTPKYPAVKTEDYIVQRLSATYA